MARRRSKTLTELELEIMHVVWALGGPVDVETIRTQLAAEGKTYAPPTIRTMLKILREKGFVGRKKEGRGYAYRALVGQEDAQAGAVSDVLHRVFGGSAAALTAALLGTEPVPAEELDAIKRLVAQKEKEGEQ